MKIGIDISVIQSHHRMRGIGYTLINFINNLSNKDKTSNSFIFYLYNEPENDPLELLELEGLNYEIRYINVRKYSKGVFPGKLERLNGLINQIRWNTELIRGDSRIKDLDDIDIFMQFDQNQPLPSRRVVKSILIIYDLIPFVMEADYLNNYKTSRAKGHSRKGSLKIAYHRKNYIYRLRKITSKAHRLVAISEHTKNDFVKYIGIKPTMIEVCYLGVQPLKSADLPDKVNLSQFVKTSWGPMAQPLTLKNKKFLMFVGGADPRRKLKELVAAYNNLRAQGVEITLVLAGDTMKGAFEIPNLELQSYFNNTSYLDGIKFVGFVSDLQREWLYKNALAFVYPSVYEGFGLPVLEAMQHGTPVITYSNSSIKEVAGGAALYVTDYLNMKEVILKLMNNSDLYKEYSKLGQERAANFSWKTTSENIINILKK